MNTDLDSGICPGIRVCLRLTSLIVECRFSGHSTLGTRQYRDWCPSGFLTAATFLLDSGNHADDEYQAASARKPGCRLPSMPGRRSAIAQAGSEYVIYVKARPSVSRGPTSDGVPQ